MIRQIYEKNGGNDMMDQLVIGILAHVDAGKTTLTEAMTTATGLGYGLVHTGVTVAAPSSAS